MPGLSQHIEDGHNGLLCFQYASVPFFRCQQNMAEENQLENLSNKEKGAI